MTERLTRSAGLIGAATVASRVLGLVRDMVQAALFSTSHANDAFVIATRIPTLLRDLFAEGAMSAAFVPTFTRYLTKEGKASAWRLGAQVINALVLVTGALVILGMIFARPIAESYAPGYASVPDKLELTVTLTRLNMPFLLLVAVAAAFMGMLNALRRFFVPASAPTVYNIVFIVCALALTPVFARAGVPPIMSLTAGMLFGGLAQIVTQWPLLRREGYHHQWVLNPRDPGLREMLLLMGPGTLGMAAAQVNIFVNTVLATSEAGAPSALSYAFRFMYMPVGIFGVSVATAALPDLAQHAATQAHDRMRETLSWGLRHMLVLSVPATIGLMVLASPIVELIYERGRFDAHSAVMVAASLIFYAPGIVGYSIVKIASPSFYSLRDARTPVLISVLTIAANLVLNLWLHGLLGFRGLALGTSIAANLNAGLLLWLLARRLDGIDERRFMLVLTKTLVASAVMGLAAYAVEAELHLLMPAATFLARALRVGGAIVAALAVLALAARALRIDEFQDQMRALARRVRR